MGINKFKFLRNTSRLFTSYDDALNALQEQLSAITDGEACLASYGDDWESAKTLMGVVRVNGDSASGEVRSYTIYDDIEVGDGLQINEGIVSIKLDSGTESFLTVTEDGLKLSGIDELTEDYEERITTLENGATKDVLSISASSVGNGNVELTGTSALQSTITVSGTNQYFNGVQSTIDASKLSLWQGSSEVTLNSSGKATVTLPTTANTSISYTGKMTSSTTASDVSISYRMVTRIYARYDTASPSVSSFISTSDGSSAVADSTTVRSNAVTSVAQTLTIPVNGTGDKYVYFAVPNYLTVSGGTLPDSLSADIGISKTGDTVSKSLGGAMQTWNIYKTNSTFASGETVRITLK